MLEFFAPLLPFIISVFLVVAGLYIKPLNRNGWALGGYLGGVLLFCVVFSLYLLGGG